MTGSFEARLDEMAGMRRLARSLLRDASLADDVVQEAALAAWRRDGEGGALPRSWWAAVVRNVAAKVKRGRERRMERERAVATREAQPGADAVARRLALHRAVVAAVEQLAPEQRDVVVRRWFDGHKPQRIAAELGVPIATVKTRLRRALDRLRERLRREWGDGVAAMLLSLARPRVAGSAAAAGAVATGAIVMGTKVKLALAGVVVALACAAWVAQEMRRSRERVRRELATVGLAGAAVADRTADRAVEGAATREPQRLEPETTPAAPKDPLRFGRITGAVVDEDGPIPGARVELVQRIGGELEVRPALRDVLAERRRSAVSSADGSFEFTDVRRGVVFTLEATGPRDLLGESVEGVHADAHVVLTLTAPARIVGSVRRPGGAPVADATVVARPCDAADAARERQTRTDAAGRFVFERLPPVPMDVRPFTPAGHVASPVRALPTSGETVEIEIEVTEGCAVDGVVVDDRDGHPIRGAQIHLADEERSGVPIAVSDDAGRFRIQSGFSWPYAQLLLVRASGYCFEDYGSVIPADPPASIECRLRRGRRLSGRVVRDDGTAVADAAIAFISAQDLSGDSIHLSQESGAARTAADGTFALADVDPRADHLLVVRDEEGAGATLPVPGSATSQDDVALGDVVLRRGASVSGTLLDLERRPVGGRHVSLRPRLGAPPKKGRERLRAEYFALCTERFAITSRDGGFAFTDVPPGDWLVESSFGLYGTTSPLRVAVEGEELHDGLELVIETGKSISGRVVDASGRPVESAWLYVGRSDDPPDHFSMMRRPEPDGSFLLRGLRPGVVRVMARCPGSQLRQARRLAPAIADVAAGASDVVLEMPEGARVGGRVEYEDGSPAARAVVTLLDGDGGRLGETRVEKDGSFELVVAKSKAGAPSSDAARGSLQLKVVGPARGTVAHPQESGTLQFEHVELDGPDLALRLPLRGD